MSVDGAALPWKLPLVSAEMGEGSWSERLTAQLRLPPGASDCCSSGDSPSCVKRDYSNRTSIGNPSQ